MNDEADAPAQPLQSTLQEAPLETAANKIQKKRNKVRSAWISFVGRIVAQMMGAAATIALGLIISVHQYGLPEAKKARAARAQSVHGRRRRTGRLTRRPLDRRAPTQTYAQPARQELADAMTDAVIADLSRTKDLRVISRTSSMQYESNRKALPVIGRELAVDMILEGSITSHGDQVRIIAQLIDAKSDEHVWTGPYRPIDERRARPPGRRRRRHCERGAGSVEGDARRGWKSAARQGYEACSHYWKLTLVRRQSVDRSAGASGSVTLAETGVAEGGPGNWKELPLIAAVCERELQDAVHAAERLAVGRRTVRAVQRRAARSHRELPNPAHRIGAAVRILRSEALVEMLVASDHDVRVELVEHAPDLAHARVGAVRARTERRPVPVGQGALTAGA